MKSFCCCSCECASIVVECPETRNEDRNSNCFQVHQITRSLYITGPIFPSSLLLHHIRRFKSSFHFKFITTVTAIKSYSLHTPMYCPILSFFHPCTDRREKHVLGPLDHLDLDLKFPRHRPVQGYVIHIWISSVPNTISILVRYFTDFGDSKWQANN